MPDYQIVIWAAISVGACWYSYRRGHDKGRTRGLLEGAAVGGGEASTEGAGGTRPVIR